MCKVPNASCFMNHCCCHYSAQWFCFPFHSIYILQRGPHRFCLVAAILVHHPNKMHVEIVYGQENNACETSITNINNAVLIFFVERKKQQMTIFLGRFLLHLNQAECEKMWKKTVVSQPLSVDRDRCGHATIFRSISSNWILRISDRSAREGESSRNNNRNLF